jgi:putative Mn2+ efflux pump MntP
MSGTGTLLSMAAGEWLNDRLSEESGNLIGSGLMILIGLHGVVHALRGASRGPPRIEREATTSGEAAILAVSLSLNNLGIAWERGSRTSVSPQPRRSPPWAAWRRSSVDVASGARVDRDLEALARLTAGLLLVVVGIYEFFV